MAKHMRMTIASALLGLWTFWDVAEAYPSMYTCDFACMSGLVPGAAWGKGMGVANLEATAGANCAITTDIPAGGYVAGNAYTVTITSTIALGYILASDVAGFAGTDRKTVGSMVTSSPHEWTATTATSAKFSALCGAGGAIRKVYVADLVTVNAAPPPTTVSLAPGETYAPTTTVITTTLKATTVTTTTVTAANTGGYKNSVELVAGLTMKTNVDDAAKTIEIAVISDRNSWVGVGFSSGTAVSMIGQDLYACTNGAVNRYWVTSKSAPSGGTPVVGSSCAFVNGKTTMTFSRPQAAAGANTVAITPGTSQVVI